MGLMDLFKPRQDVMREKIIYTQKNRITSLEKDLDEVKQLVRLRESELKEVRTNFERGKERLVDQIIELSDKFAEINDSVAKMAHENGRFKALLEAKRPLLEHKKKK